MANKSLKQFILDNPTCHFIIDNDCWYAYTKEPTSEQLEDEEWIDKNIVFSGDFEVTVHSGYR